MWEGDCQVVCVNNKGIIGLCSRQGPAVAARGSAGVGWGMTLALHTIRPTRGSNGGGVPALSFMRGMSLCPRLSQGMVQVTVKGPELSLCLEMKASCEYPADLRPG